MIKKIKKFFLFEKHTCPWWLAYSWDNRIRKTFHNTEEILKPYLSEGMTVLDTGCGMGYFSIHMAGYIGKAGKVISVDIQKEMLEILQERAKRKGVDDIIVPHLSQGDLSAVTDNLDFALNFWMLHEVDEPELLVKQIFDLLKPGGKYLIAEPKIHTTKKHFESLIEMCKNTGFKLELYPKINFSRSVLFVKEDA